MIGSEMQQPRFDSRGMSLIEMLIALGISGVILMTMMDMLRSQTRETRALSEKLAALDFQRTVVGAISVAASCGKNLSSGNLAPGHSLIFNPGAITSSDKNNPTVIAKLQKVYGMDGVTALADSTAADRSVSPLSPNVKLQAGSGMQLAAHKDPTSGQLVYQLLLAFDGGALVRPIRNLAMTVNATTASAGGSNLQVTGCIGASAPVVPPIKSGMLCGNRFVFCGGWRGVAYDQAFGTYNTWSWKSSNIPCQGVTLTADCQSVIDGSGYPNGGTFINNIYGCPAGWSGAHTMVGSLSTGDPPNIASVFSPGQYNEISNVSEMGYIYCVKD